VSAEVDRIVAASPRRADLESTLATAGIACLVDSPADAMAVANTVAPEHLQLMVTDADAPALVAQVECAGAVFVGPWAPASLGDYIAGPNHVLPTNRTARFSSALRADDFRKHIHAVTVTTGAIEALGPSVITLAETEGLPAHADSVRRRLAALKGALS
jgi:histidinol dehydrogenase